MAEYDRKLVLENGDEYLGRAFGGPAGGAVSDHHGRPWRFNRPDPRQASLICAAPALHPQIVRRCLSAPMGR